jgi:hypothetical protein
MFAEFENFENNSEFKIIRVKLNNNIENYEDFNNFLNGWLELYKKKEDFIFLFDTSTVGYIPVKYCYRMAKFISELKQLDKQYLKRSFIVANSWIVKLLLRLTFNLQSPVAPVYIIRTQELAVSMNQDITDMKSLSLYDYYAYYPK